jgi:lysophospholipase L1-like esterase
MIPKAEKLRKLAGNIALSGVSILLALGAAEFALRIFGPPPPPADDTLRTFTEYDPELGWKGRPDAHGIYRNRRFTTWIDQNREGWRDDEPVPKSPAKAGEPGSGAPDAPHQPRIAVLGDSYVWGYGVSSEEMFTRRLKELLPGSEVRNFGVPGYGTDQELLVFRRFVLEAHPGTVILAFTVGNDLTTIASRSAYDLPKPRFVLDRSALRLEGVPVPRLPDWDRVSRSTEWKKSLMAHSYLYAWIRPRWRILRERLTRANEMRRVRLLARRPDDRLRESWRLAEALLGAIRGEATRSGMRMVVLVVPERLQVDDRLWKAMVRRYRIDESGYDRDLPGKTLASIGERQGFVVVDPLERLRDRMRAGENPFLGDDPHWSAIGHQVAAQALTEALRSSPGGG